MTNEKLIADLRFQIECYRYTIAAITYTIPSFCGEKSSPEDYVKLEMESEITLPLPSDFRWESDARLEILKNGPPKKPIPEIEDTSKWCCLDGDCPNCNE